VPPSCRPTPPSTGRMTRTTGHTRSGRSRRRRPRPMQTWAQMLSRLCRRAPSSFTCMSLIGLTAYVLPVMVSWKTCCWHHQQVHQACAQAPRAGSINRVSQDCCLLCRPLRLHQRRRRRRPPCSSGPGRGSSCRPGTLPPTARRSANHHPRQLAYPCVPFFWPVSDCGFSADACAVTSKARGQLVFGCESADDPH
jgi:hypothetical protein